VFWNLLLAHLAGDFIFQTDWMIRNRKSIGVSALHAGIHFALMVLLVGPSRSAAWPALLLLATLHISQDALKTRLVRKHPGWLKTAFIVDQIAHLTLIQIFIRVFQLGPTAGGTAQKPALVMVMIAYLFATYVWFIIERTFNQSDPQALAWISDTKYRRMLTRGGLISGFLLVRSWALPGLAMVMPELPASGKYRRRAWVTDICVSLAAMAFLFWALGWPA
jgi:hypothetical protein